MITRTLGSRAALVAVAALGWWTGANAQNTTAGTPILNRATVNYTVGSLAQAPIESSPNGNTTPGVGNGLDTSFLVDNRVDLSVTQTTGSVVVTPGMTNQVLAFTVANAGNSPQGYQLTMTEEVGTTEFGNPDNADFGPGNLIVRVDDGNGIYDGTESATAIDTLAPSASITVFVVSPTVPLALINGNFANVNLRAQTAVPGTNGGTILAQSIGANTDGVEVLFADALPNRDGMADDSGQFSVVSAGLTITKTQQVVDDPFGSASPRALPLSHVEYTITIENTSATTPALGVSLSDPIPGNTSLYLAQYTGEDVEVTGGVVPTATCTADANDGDNDGCGLVAGALEIEDSVIGDIAGGATVTVAFQVTIL